MVDFRNVVKRRTAACARKRAWAPSVAVVARHFAWALIFIVVAIGACACADDASAPSVPAATLVAGPVVPVEVPPLPIPSAATLTVAPPAPPIAVDADAARAAWLAGPLTGRDNSMARHREARITTRADGGYEVYVKNQFAFRCALTFAPDGRPALFERCRSGEAGWRASPASIPVTCATTATEEACEGPFRLLYPSSGGSPAALRIVRVVARAP